MRLPEKQEIDRQQNEERRKDIEEGAKLAKRIDELRRLEAEEKSRITKWRDSTLEITKQEIEDSIKTRDSIRAETERLRLEQAKLRQPLDKEWASVEQEKQKTTILADATETRISVALKKEQELATRERQIEVETGKIADTKKLVAQKLSEAEKSLTKAHEDSAEMRNKAHTTLLQAELTNTLAQERELQVAIRERDVDNKEKNVILYEERLFKKEQQLKDLDRSLQATAKELYGESNSKRSVKKGR